MCVFVCIYSDYSKVERVIFHQQENKITDLQYYILEVDKYDIRKSIGNINTHNVFQNKN